MENASKALLIAASILVALLILGILIKTFSNISLFQKSNLTEEEQKEIIAFNEQYTKYINQYVYGTELITVINKTLDNTAERIAVYIKFIEGDKFYILDKNGNYNQSFINSIDSYDLKSKAFKCTSIGYDDKTGRVNSISFEEKK